MCRFTRFVSQALYVARDRAPAGRTASGRGRRGGASARARHDVTAVCLPAILGRARAALSTSPASACRPLLSFAPGQQVRCGTRQLKWEEAWWSGWGWGSCCYLCSWTPRLPLAAASPRVVRHQGVAGLLALLSFPPLRLGSGRETASLPQPTSRNSANGLHKISGRQDQASI